MNQPTAQKKTLREWVEQAGYDTIGQRLFRIREVRSLSLRELSETAGVSKNTLLRLEQGLPTHLSTIKEVCRALKLRPAELMGDEFPEHIIYSVHRHEHSRWYDMNTFESMSKDEPLTGETLDKIKELPKVTAFTHLMSRFSGGYFNPNIFKLEHATPMRSHRGEEFAFIISGTLRVKFDRSHVDVEEGESIIFWAAENHCYEPIGDTRPVTILSIVLDPYPALCAAETKDFLDYLAEKNIQGPAKPSATT